MVTAACGGSRTTPAPLPVPTTATFEEVRPPAFRPDSVSFVSADRGWVLGAASCGDASCPSLLHTTDGGASWQSFPPPPIVAGHGRIRFANERNGWVYGPDLWATHDGGASWRKLDALPGPVMSLEASAGVAYAVSGGRVFTADAGDDAWRRAGDHQVDPYASLVGGYVVGGDGAVLAVTAGGLDRRGTPCPGAGAALAVVGADVLAVCGGGGALGSSMKSLNISSDGGRTWRRLGTPPAGGSVVAVAGASASTVVIAASSGGSWLYRTEDGGRTWTTVYSEPSGAPFDDLEFVDPAHGAVVVNERLLLTSDAGRSWTPATF